MLDRDIRHKIQDALEQYPVVSVTGPRQCGKTTLLKSMLPNWKYISLEDPDVRELALSDPREFLRLHADHVILDEAQRAPELFSYLQGAVDRTGRPGQFVISGSQNYLLMKSVTQTLAGRVAVIRMSTLTRHEIMAGSPEDLARPDKGGNLLDESIEDRWSWIVIGGYPRLYDYGMSYARYFADYLATYLERDVREELGVIKLAEFERFIGLCATRTAEMLNVSSLASDAGVDVKTARGWISALEAGGILFELHPHHANIGKRLVKTPKLYFYDTGLACALLGIHTVDELLAYDKRGNLFETAVVAEYLKCAATQDDQHQTTYYKKSGNSSEVDLVVERGVRPAYAFEIKSSSTYKEKFFGTIVTLGDELGIPPQHRGVIYNGSASFNADGRGMLLTPDDMMSIADETIFLSLPKSME